MTTTSHQVPLAFLVILLSYLLIPLASATHSSPIVASSHQASFQVHIERISSRSNLTKMEIIQRTIKLEGLAVPAAAPSPSVDFQSYVIQAEEEFIMNLSIGTPQRHYSAIMDTGSSLIWTQCMPCKSCYEQPTPIFNPNTSSTFSLVPCSSYLCSHITRECETDLCRYRTTYGDLSFTEGYLATETFTLGDSLPNASISIPNLAFGCGDSNAGVGLDIVAGIVGLARGPLSLVSQLKSKKFSYCLPALGEKKKGTLSIGSLADKGFDSSNKSKGTPLLRNPFRPSLYYVSLEGISIDHTRLPVPKSLFELRMDGSGGTVLDSGTTITYLVREAYQLLKLEFVRRTRLPVVSSQYTYMDLCFQMPFGKSASDISFPKLKFHFKDMVLELPKENYMVDNIRERSICLGIMPSLSFSLFGSLQQQNFLVLHNLEKQRVSFFPHQCA